MTHNVEDSKFALHNRKEIVFILEEIAKHRTAINLETREGAMLVTAVLGVSAEGNHVYMDVSSDPVINEKIVASKHVSFSTQTGVKVRWHASHLHLVELTDGGDAFSMLVPAVVERIQRREFFRLNTPQGSNALICKIPAADEIVSVVIVDMSVGGIGCSLKGTPPEEFSPGALLEGCSIELPEVGRIPMNLRVRGIWKTIKTKSGEQMHHIGLQFEDLSRGAANVIQRYLIHLEAEQRKLI